MSESPQKILVRQWTSRAENDLGPWIPQIQERREALRWLTAFAVASRYPVETVEIVDESQGRRSLDIAQAIRRDCRSYLMELEPMLFD